MTTSNSAQTLAFRLILFFSLLFGLALSSQATEITFVSTTIPNVQAGAGTYELRIWLDRGMVDSDGVTQAGGAVDSPNVFKKVTCTLAGTTLTIPSLTLVSTLDARVGAQAKYTAKLYRSGAPLLVYGGKSFALPASLGTTITWSQVWVFNEAVPNRVLDNAYYTAAQTNAQIAAATSTAICDPAATSTLGCVETSVAPISASIPIARGTNDPVLLDAKEYASFSAAVTAVCATANTLHVSTASTAVTANTTIPNDCTVKFVGPGSLTVNTGITLTFAQRAGIVGEHRRLFLGAGSVVFPAANYAYEIRPRWFAAGSGTYADPYTEWSTRTTWGGNSYRFSKEVYSHSASPAFSQMGIKIYGEGAVILGTSSGVILNVLSSSRSAGAHTFGVYIENLVLEGVTATHGMYVATTHQSTFKNIRVRNMGGIAFYFRGSNLDVLDTLTTHDPIGDSIIGDFYRAVTVVPTTGVLFDYGAIFPGDAATNNAMDIRNLDISYVAGRGVDIKSLVSSAFWAGAVELCSQEGFVITGAVDRTIAVSVNGTEIEHNNGSGGDIYVNSKSISFHNLLSFNGVINIDSGAESILLAGGVFDTINVLAGVKSASLIGLRYNYTGSGDLNNGGQYTFIKNVLDNTSGVYYPDTFFGIPVTPAQLTADAHNWNAGRNLHIRASSDSSRNVTGMSSLQSGEDGRIQYLWNVGSNNIVLVNESASSSAANRFTTSTGADLTVAPKKVAMLMYDNTSQRWRVTLLP